jgi:hypothetical protein
MERNGGSSRVVSRLPLSLVRTRWSDGRRVASAMATAAGARAGARRVWSGIDGEVPKAAVSGPSLTQVLSRTSSGSCSWSRISTRCLGRRAAHKPDSLARESILLLDPSVAPRDEAGPRYSRKSRNCGPFVVLRACPEAPQGPIWFQFAAGASQRISDIPGVRQALLRHRTAVCRDRSRWPGELVRLVVGRRHARQAQARPQANARQRRRPHAHSGASASHSPRDLDPERR